MKYKNTWSNLFHFQWIEKLAPTERHLLQTAVEMENEEILPHTCPSMAGLVFQLAGDDDLVDIEEFLLIHFFPVEPLGSLVKVDVQIEVRPWLARFVANVVSERRSIIVRDVSTSPNQLVAVRLNSLEIKGER